MKNKYINSWIFVFLTLIFVFLTLIKVQAQEMSDYPLDFITDSCKVVNELRNKDELTMLQGREKYRDCMNFVLAIASSLNGRCISYKNNEIKKENNLTYADLSSVISTKDIIKVIIEYSEVHPEYAEQAAWIHSARAISQKWPCIN